MVGSSHVLQLLLVVDMGALLLYNLAGMAVTGVFLLQDLQGVVLDYGGALLPRPLMYCADVLC
jgi:hypothetical protein